MIYTFLLSGLVGQLQKRKSDIGFANLFVVPDRMKYIDYTDPYMIEYASFMLSRKSFGIILLEKEIFSSKTSKPSTVVQNSPTSSNIYMDRHS